MDAVIANPRQDLKKANYECYRSLDAQHGIISRGSSGTRADVPMLCNSGIYFLVFSPSFAFRRSARVPIESGFPFKYRE